MPCMCVGDRAGYMAVLIIQKGRVYHLTSKLNVPVVIIEVNLVHQL